jgi:hypothetical protein
MVLGGHWFWRCTRAPVHSKPKQKRAPQPNHIVRPGPCTVRPPRASNMHQHYFSCGRAARCRAGQLGVRLRGAGFDRRCPFGPLHGTRGGSMIVLGLQVRPQLRLLRHLPHHHQRSQPQLVVRAPVAAVTRRFTQPQPIPCPTFIQRPSPVISTNGRWQRQSSSNRVGPGQANPQGPSPVIITHGSRQSGRAAAGWWGFHELGGRFAETHQCGAGWRQHRWLWPQSPAPSHAPPSPSSSSTSQ